MKYFCIADLVLQIEENGISLQKELKDFAMDEASALKATEILKLNLLDCATSTAVFCPLYDRLEDFSKLVDFSFLAIYEGQEEYRVIYHWPQAVFGYSLSKKSDAGDIYIDKARLAKQDTSQVKLEKERDCWPEDPQLLLYSIRDAFFFLAQRKGRIALHSSSIIYKDRVFLFMAPSGGGKSTIVDNWKRADLSYQDFNGDVIMCYEHRGQVLAAGLPWCGTSGIYTNTNLPLGGGLFIYKDMENQLKGLEQADAALLLNARALTPNWNRELTNLNLKRAISLVEKLSFAQLNCGNNPEAALVSKGFFDSIEQKAEGQEG